MSTTTSSPENSGYFSLSLHMFSLCETNKTTMEWSAPESTLKTHWWLSEQQKKKCRLNSCYNQQCHVRVSECQWQPKMLLITTDWCSTLDTPKQFLCHIYSALQNKIRLLSLQWGRTRTLWYLGILFRLATVCWYFIRLWLHPNTWCLFLGASFAMWMWTFLSFSLPCTCVHPSH